MITYSMIFFFVLLVQGCVGVSLQSSQLMIKVRSMIMSMKKFTQPSSHLFFVFLGSTTQTSISSMPVI
jgi:hypothetical protein